eukprot:gene5523-6881_t
MSSTSSSSSSTAAIGDFNKNINTTSNTSNPSTTNSQSFNNLNNTISNSSIKKNKSDFDFIKTVGKGSYGKVKLVVEKETGKGYAAKILSKELIIKQKKSKYVNTEKTILDSLDHPNIIKLYYTFQDELNLYFILEYCPNGDLLGHLKKAGCFQRNVAQFYAAEILLSIEYLHNKSIAHRDLKPENILMGKNMHVKLSDFGTAKQLAGPLGRSGSFCGTAEYVCPELLVEKSAGKEADLWSFGILLYQLISGKLPFKGFNEYQTFQVIIKREFTFPPNFDQNAQDLVDRLLNLDPRARPTIEEIKNHPFFSEVIWETLHTQDPPLIVPIEPASPLPSPSSFRRRRSLSLGSPPSSHISSISPPSSLVATSPAVPTTSTTTTTTTTIANTSTPSLSTALPVVHQRERASTTQTISPSSKHKVGRLDSKNSPLSLSLLSLSHYLNNSGGSGSGSGSNSPAMIAPRVIFTPSVLITLDKEQKKQIKEQQKDLEYSRFLLPNDEIIIALGPTEKRTGLISKKRQLIITDTPRIFYVDPSKMIEKGEIHIDHSLKAEVKSKKHFIINSKGRPRHFYDMDGLANSWVEIINEIHLLTTSIK